MAEEGEPHRSPDKDVLLTALIKITEKVEKDTSLPEEERTLHILLSVKGMLIGGELISKDAYFDHEFPQNSSSDDQGSSASSQPQGQEADPLPEERDFIHLKNTRFYTGSAPLSASTSPGFHWRGRLSSVDSFALGGLVSVPQEPRTIKIGDLDIKI